MADTYGALRVDETLAKRTKTATVLMGTGALALPDLTQTFLNAPLTTTRLLWPQFLLCRTTCTARGVTAGSITFYLKSLLTVSSISSNLSVRASALDLPESGHGSTSSPSSTSLDTTVPQRYHESPSLHRTTFKHRRTMTSKERWAGPDVSERRVDFSLGCSDLTIATFFVQSLIKGYEAFKNAWQVGGPSTESDNEQLACEGGDPYP